MTRKSSQPKSRSACHRLVLLSLATALACSEPETQAPVEEPVDESKAEVDWNENPDEGYMEVAPTGSDHIVTNAQHLHGDVFLHIEF